MRFIFTVGEDTVELFTAMKKVKSITNFFQL